jgi:hypothetical protein
MESAREAGTSLPLCFTTGFPGLPKGLLPQDLFNSSNAVHRSGYMFPLREKVEVAPMMVNVAHIFGMP